MEINKATVMKYLVVILSVVSIILLFLPFATPYVEMMGREMKGDSFNGFDAGFEEGGVFWAVLLLILPIILIVVNFVPQIAKFKGIASIAIPVLCIIFEIITLIALAPDNVPKGIDAGNSPAIGFWLLIICYIGTAIAGAVTCFGLKFSKEGLNEFKNNLKSDLGADK